MLGWIIGGIVAFLLFIGVVTPGGRKAISRMIGTAGTIADLESEKLETTERLERSHSNQVNLETREKLRKAENAFVRAEQILGDKKELNRQLAQWVSNRDNALEQAQALMSDNILDVQQAEEFGAIKSIGETAIDKINGLENSLAASAELYQWAEEIVSQAEELFRELPEKAAEQLRAGKIAAATAEIAEAQKGITDSMQAFGSSKAGKALSRLQAKASVEQAKAKASQARANAAPASADVAARMLRKMDSSKTSSFDQLLIERMTPPPTAEGLE